MSTQGKFITLVFAATLMCGSVKAAAVSGRFDKPGLDVPEATVYTSTLPPIGYVDFCGRQEDECKFSGGKVEKLALTTEAWDQIQQVNRYANNTIRPVTDIAQYAVMDYWTYPVNAGDCEDYVLFKKRLLSQLGISADELLITVVLDENQNGHAVLTIPTDKGDYILDNRRDEILRWDQTGYTYLKRQSQPQANQWVSLQKAPSAPNTSIATTGK